VKCGLAPAAAHCHDLPGAEAELRLKGLAAVGAFPLLGPPMYPVVMSRRLLAILTHAYIAKARFAAKF